jgi:hypothetical protein
MVILLHKHRKCITISLYSYLDNIFDKEAKRTMNNSDKDVNNYQKNQIPDFSGNRFVLYPTSGRE